MPASDPLTQSRQTPHRAQPPRPPEPTREYLRRESGRLESFRARFHIEQRSLLRGLILLALVILVASLARSGFSRLFVPGWWRQW